MSSIRWGQDERGAWWASHRVLRDGEIMSVYLRDGVEQDVVPGWPNSDDETGDAALHVVSLMRGEACDCPHCAESP